MIRALAIIAALAGCSTTADQPPTDPSTGGKADGDGSDGSAATTKGTISIEVDYVGYQRFRPGTIDALTSYFASIGYTLVIEQSDVLDPVDRVDYGTQSLSLRDYYLQHFQHRGQPGWHYMLMADELVNSNRGWGMLGGDMFVIDDETDANPDHPMEAQVSIILHELGHNLGLVHEGFEPEISAGTHNKSTCAVANTAPEPDVPVMFYSPNCVKHIQLASTPFFVP